MTAGSHSDSWNASRLPFRLVLVAALASAALIVAGRSASAGYYVYTYQSTTGASGDAAQANISVKDGEIDILLQNTEASTGSVGNEVSGIVIGMANAVGAITLTNAFASDSSGNRNPAGLINFATGLQSGTTGDLTHWSASSAANTITASTFSGMKPTGLISSPNYPAGGPSGGSSHDPNAIQYAYFTLSAVGVTFNELINSVTFDFGTGPDGTTATQLTNTQLVVPEPRSIALMLTGLLGLAAVRRFRRA